jgi:diguanylate cyclase (GGDEF)-like protein/PAS domain S-box-containing protein
MDDYKKSMQSIYPAIRISFALTWLTVCILMAADFFGFIPNEKQYLLESRKKNTEAIAIQFLAIDPVKNIKTSKQLIKYIVKRNSDMLSAAIRSQSGRIIYQSADHEKWWQGYNKKESTSTHVYIPLHENGKPWGNAEFRFTSLKSNLIQGIFEHPLFKVSMFVFCVGFFSYLAFMLRALRQLDPSSVIPERVNIAFDTLAEGIIIIDENENIIMANKSFSNTVEWSRNGLIGKKISSLRWKPITKKTVKPLLPWLETLETGKNAIGIQLTTKTATGNTIKFSVNASSISDDGSKVQGVLITLSDITQFEERNTELQSIVSQLKQSQIQVEQQNKELSYLATHDPLSGCLNRRSFSEQFEPQFNIAKRNNSELSCIMVDLDHFKSVNDNYGHARGDEVIKMLSKILKTCTRKIDLVGRYGGEEFCLVFPGISEEMAITVSERIRLEIQEKSEKRFNGQPRVTASIGVSSMSGNPKNPDDLVNKADQALYVAKESGRNQVVLWRVE